MKYLAHDVLPRWYSLSWDSANLAIRIAVQPEFAATLAPLSPAAPVVAGLAEELDLVAFQGGFEDSRFGFERGL